MNPFLFWENNVIIKMAGNGWRVWGNGEWNEKKPEQEHGIKKERNRIPL